MLIDFSSISVADKSLSPAELDVSVGSGRSGKKFGSVRFEYCRFFCRQVVKSEFGDLPAVFQLGPLPTKEGCVPITFDLRQGGSRSVAIKNVALVPIEKWDISLIKPESACLVVNGKCSPEVYPDPPAGSVITNFVSSPTTSQLTTTLSFHNTPHVVALGPSMKHQFAFYLQTNITMEGRYFFFVHYFQPVSSTFQLLGITLNSDRGSSFRHIGSLTLLFCPKIMGCFQEIEFPTAVEGVILPQGIVSVDFAINPNIGSTYLHRLFVVPSYAKLKPVFDVQPFDLSSRFYTQCTSKGYFIEEAKQNDHFCRTTLFTLTTAYNQGALACDCNESGLDLTIVQRMNRKCSAMGGQCYCRPNVIGRRCSACRPGFFGFPNCQRCDCDRGTCDSWNGDCICPPNVGGEKCDRCNPGAWGYNRIQGCQLCNCDPYGVVDGKTDYCDPINGNCSCRGNIESRRCDSCRSGYFNFPECTECDCEKRGTIDGICDGVTGRCLCKANIDPTSPRFVGKMSEFEIITICHY